MQNINDKTKGSVILSQTEELNETRVQCEHSLLAVDSDTSAVVYKNIKMANSPTTIFAMYCGTLTSALTDHRGPPSSSHASLSPLDNLEYLLSDQALGDSPSCLETGPLAGAVLSDPTVAYPPCSCLICWTCQSQQVMVLQGGVECMFEMMVAHRHCRHRN